MRKRVAIFVIVIAIMVLSGCSGPGGQPTDGGWLAKGANWALFLQLNGSMGTADYAIYGYGRLDHDHSDFVRVNNGHVIAFSMTQFDYAHDEEACYSGCDYDVSGDMLTLHVPSGRDSSGVSQTDNIILKSASASDFDNAVQDLKKLQGQ